MSWILEEDKLLQIQQNHPREPMDSILCYFVYVDSDSSIVTIATDNLLLYWNVEKSCKCIPKEQVLQLIQERRKRASNTQYIYKDACMFLVDLEPDNVQSYAQNKTNDTNLFVTNIPVIGDIMVPPSIFVFHGINSICFVFQEIRSILRKGGSLTRKRVLISNDNNKTRKNLNT